MPWTISSDIVSDIPSDHTPLYVRLSSEPSTRLERAVSVSGKSKRQLVEDAVREAASLLRIKEPTLKDAAERKQLPGRRIGDEWRFSRAALLSWLSESEPS